MSQRKLAAMYLRKADQDRVVFEKWREDPTVAIDILGFHAQQAAEKMLKAALAGNAVAFPYTHRLTDLIDLAKAHELSFPEELEELRFLTPFAVQFRYELYEEEDDDSLDSEGVVTMLSSLRKWTLDRLPPAEDTPPPPSNDLGDSTEVDEETAEEADTPREDGSPEHGGAHGQAESP